MPTVPAFRPCQIQTRPPGLDFKAMPHVWVEATGAAFEAMGRADAAGLPRIAGKRLLAQDARGRVSHR